MTLEELKLDIKWWESRRWIYNLAVGVFGILGLYKGISRGEYYWSKEDIFGIIWWALFVNIAYSLGVLLELFDWYYLKDRVKIKRFRMLFFIIGLLFSCFWTLWCSWFYFAKPYLW